MEEVEKFKKQKAELEALGDSSQVKQDRNMKVCEVCGALQSAGDTDKRLTMHLEGKLHTGYLRIRKKLAELKNKRLNDRRSGRRSRSRSRSPRGYSSRRDRDTRRNEQEGNDAEHIFDKKIVFSSKKLGSGLNVPSSSICAIKFASIAVQQNEGYSGDFVEMGMNSLGKEWKSIKRELDKARRAAKKEAERKAEAEKKAQTGGKYGDKDHRDDRGGGGSRGYGGRREDGGSSDRPRSRMYDESSRPPRYGGHHR